jgi:hypothetical protein
VEGKRRIRYGIPFSDGDCPTLACSHGGIAEIETDIHRRGGIESYHLVDDMMEISHAFQILPCGELFRVRF